MKKIITLLFSLALLILVGNWSTAFADLQAVPARNIPTNQRDKFQTDLFTGGATYSTPIQVPKGTNGLTPDVNVSYSSLGIHDANMQTGIGWQIDRDYVQRDVNYT